MINNVPVEDSDSTVKTRKYLFYWNSRSSPAFSATKPNPHKPTNFEHKGYHFRKVSQLKTQK